MNEKEAYHIRLLSDPQICDDRILFTENWIEDDYKSSIMVLENGKARRVTFSGKESLPKMRGDSLYFIRSEKDYQALMVMDPYSEPREIYRNKEISDYIFHNDAILAVVRDAADDDRPFEVTKLKYRYDSKGYLRTRYKLILIDEKITDLVSGDFDVTDVYSNGKRVIFSATIENDDTGLSDVYDLDIETGKFKKLTDRSGEVTSICLSDTGEVAYLGHREGTIPWAANRLIFPEKNVEIRLNNDINNIITDHFVPSSNKILFDRGSYYFVVENGSSSALYSYNGTLKKMTDDGINILSFTVHDGKIAYIYTSFEKPSVMKYDGGFYDPNADVKGSIPERIEVDGKEAWIMISSKDDPTIVFVHGGPQTAYGNAYYIEFNYLHSNGYNVIFGNPRGSAGYGEEFARQCVGDWGGKDFEDIISFMDAAIQKYGLEDNFAITGGSYGGYMTNAAITKTNRFKCAISERCVSNLISMCGTSDIGFWFNPEEIGVSDPWSPEGLKKMIDFSPVFHTKNVRTPTMFIHGENDFRCPIEQAEQMYIALKMNGVPSVMVRYPGDSHEHARHGNVRNMQDRLKRKLEFFDRYTKKGSA